MSLATQIASHDASHRLAALKFLLDKHSDSCPEGLSLLLGKIVRGDADVNVRLMAIGAAQTPIQSLYSALRDINEEVRCEAFRVLLTDHCVGESNDVHITQALSFLLDETNPSCLVTKLDYIIALFLEQEIICIANLAPFLGDGSNEHGRKHGVPSSSSSSIQSITLTSVLRDLNEHTAVIVRMTAAKTLGSLLKYSFRKKQFKLANVVVTILLQLLSDTVTDVARATAQAIHEAIGTLEEMPKDLELYLTSNSVIGLLSLHGGRASTAIRSDDARLVHTIFCKMTLPSFATFGLVVTFLKRRLYACPAGEAQSSSEGRELKRQELMRCILNIERRHEHFTILYNTEIIN